MWKEREENLCDRDLDHKREWHLLMQKKQADLEGQWKRGEVIEGF